MVEFRADTVKTTIELVEKAPEKEPQKESGEEEVEMGKARTRKEGEEE